MILNNSDLFFDRELSLLEFNRRVLALAQDENIPLLERFRFMCICSANLDEFFEVRVASIKQQVSKGTTGSDVYSLPPKIALEKINKAAHELIKEQYDCLNNELLPQLKEENIHFLSNDELDAKKDTALRQPSHPNTQPNQITHRQPVSAND